MPAAEKNLTIETKATFRRRLVYRDKNGKPIDLTGYAARMHIKANADDLLPLLELTSLNGRIALGGKSGAIDLVISAADTSVIAWSAAVYDLKLIAPNGDEIRILKGKVMVSAGVTS